jgi:ribosomal protein S18 acetylase RimI-like enzyme
VARAVGGLLPPRATFYLAELGVCPGFRGLGIGRRLVIERLKRIDRDRYTQVLLRVAAEKNRSYDMYLSLGFEDTGVYMEVPARRVDGVVRTDHRLFLSHTLSQVPMDRIGDVQVE